MRYNVNIPYEYIYQIVQDDDVASIIDDVISRIDSNYDDIEDEIYQAIADSLIYYDDEWAILKYYYYYDIKNANYFTALENFNTLIGAIICQYNKKEVK